MADIFDEIRSDLAQEKWRYIWRTYKKHISAALIILLTAALAFFFFHRRRQNILVSQSNEYLQSIFSLKAGEGAQTIQRFERIPLQGETIYANLSRLWVAASLEEAGDEKGAESIYLKILSETKGFFGMGGNKPLHDFALVKWAYLKLDSGDPGAILEKIKPLMDKGCAWRFAAREIAGLLEERGGNNQEALSYYKKNLEDKECPLSYRSKAQLLSNRILSSEGESA